MHLIALPIGPGQVNDITNDIQNSEAEVRTSVQNDLNSTVELKTLGPVMSN